MLWDKARSLVSGDTAVSRALVPVGTKPLWDFYEWFGKTEP